MRLLSHAAILGAVALATAGTIGAMTTVSAHTGNRADQQGTAGGLADGSTFAMETFDYPNGAKVLEDQHVKLISGDGHIVIADCATPIVNNVSVIQVHTLAMEQGEKGKVCFKVLRNAGYLKLELREVFSIRGDGWGPGSGHNITATLKTDAGVLPPVAINPTGNTPVGTGSESAPTALLELRVAP